MTKTRDFAPLLLFLLLAFAVAAFGALWTPGPWYAALEKPSWNPPSWLFGPVWTTLYAMIAVAGWLVWRRRETAPVRPAMIVYTLQLLLNGAWSWIFFGVHEMGWALVEIVLLAILIAINAALFWRVRRLAGALLLPYLAWVSFAAFLNATLWRLNPEI